MVTFVGTQEDFGNAVKELIELDYTAVDAYQAAIERLDNPTYQVKLMEFKKDHERHITEFSALLRKHKEDVPQKAPLGKDLLSKGKVVIANLLGDNSILQAMISNEMDTNTAYERMNTHEHKWSDAQDIIKQGLEDEKRHKAWLEANLS